MASKERELLRRWFDDRTLEREEWDTLVEDTKELLAQPEQEPVAWMYERQSESFTERTLSVRFEKNFDGITTPLYTSPPKTEQATLKLRESSATETFNDVVNEALEFKPVAWKDRTYGNLHHVDYGNSIPLYASPPKREPLSDEDVTELLMGGFSTHLMDLVKMVELAHGIGVDDE